MRQCARDTRLVSYPSFALCSKILFNVESVEIVEIDFCFVFYI